MVKFYIDIVPSSMIIIKINKIFLINIFLLKGV